MINYKKKIILTLIEKLQRKDISAKSLQKYLFLFTRLSGNKVYDFVPYKYGCFSFEANKDIVALSKAGYINIENTPHSECSYQLNKIDFDLVEDMDMFDMIAINRIIEKFGSLSQNELIAFTYRKWPYTAINSIIKDRLLNEDELKRVAEMKNRYKRSDSVLYTMGYEGVTLEKYLNYLITNDVQVLVDVRKNAFSMKYGFSKAILEKALNGVGIKYIHVPELGIESQDRKSLSSQEDYDKLFEIYEQTTLLENWDALLKVRRILDSNKRICLMCFERDPKQCHRTRVAKALMSLPNVYYHYMPITL